MLSHRLNTDYPPEARFLASRDRRRTAKKRFRRGRHGGDKAITRTRYNAYRYFLSSLELADFTESERALFGDAAEGFLLGRSDSPELAELANAVEIALEGVVRSGRLSPWAAEQARSWIEACGPASDRLVPALA
jgi:hypothetical protein